MGELMGMEVIQPNISELEKRKIEKIKIALLDEITDIVEDESFMDDDLRKEVDDIDIDAATIEYLVDFLRELKVISREDSFKHKISKNINQGEIEPEREKIKRMLLVAMEEIRKGNHPNIGDGTSASVFASGKIPEHCFKLIRNFSEYTNCNSIVEELSFLDEVGDLDVNGIRAPRPRVAFECEDIHILVMETLDAVNLEDVLLGKEKMPGNFNLEQSLDDLDKYFEILNKQYRIVHNDVYARNLMVDRKSGQFYVIDFGKAERIRVDTNNNLLYNLKAQNSGDSKNLTGLRSTLKEKLKL